MIKVYKDALRNVPNSTLVMILFLGVVFVALAFKNFRSLMLVEYFHFSEESMSFLIGALGFGSIIGTWFTGRLLKVLPPYTVIGITLLFCSLGPIFLTFLKSGALVPIGFFFFAVFSNAVRPAFQLVILDLESDTKQSAYSLYRISINFGTALGGLLAGIIAEYSYLYLLIYVSGLLIAVAIGFLFVSKTEVKVTENIDESRQDKAFLGIDFYSLMAITFIFSFAMFQIYSFLPVFIVQDIGLSIGQFGGLSIANLIVILAFELYLVKKLSARGPFITGIVGSLVMAAAYAIAALKVSSVIIVYIFYSLICLAISLFFPFIMSAIDIYSKGSDRRVYMIQYQYTIDIAIIVSPIISAFIVGYIEIQGLWLVCSLMSILVVAVLIFKNLTSKTVEAH